MTHHFWTLARERPRTTAAALLLLLTAGVTWLYAHEGHQPVPTRGVLVEPDKGLIVLSPEARAALAVQTAEADTHTFHERVTAPATLVAPWQAHAFAGPRLGGRVVAVHVRPGQVVGKGQRLAEVQSLELENLLLEMLTAHNEARLAAANLKGMSQAARDGAISDRTKREHQVRHRE